MDKKPRKMFTLWGKGSALLGYGIYYPHGGNVQLFLKSSGYEAWQISSLGEVLLLEGVISFRWRLE